MVFLSRPYHFKFFKGCLPQILLGLFMNTLTQIGIPGLIGIVSFRFCAVIPELEPDPGIDLRVAAGIGFASTSPGVRGFTAENGIQIQTFNCNINPVDQEKSYLNLVQSNIKKKPHHIKVLLNFS